MNIYLNSHVEILFNKSKRYRQRNIFCIHLPSREIINKRGLFADEILSIQFINKIMINNRHHSFVIIIMKQNDEVFFSYDIT